MRWKFWKKPGCRLCGAGEREHCKLSCPERLCSACGGMGVTMDLSKKVGFDSGGNPIYEMGRCSKCMAS